MAGTLLRSSWTGTIGIGDGLADDGFDDMALKEQSFDAKPEAPSPRLVLAIWSYGWARFGAKSLKMSYERLEKLWYNDKSQDRSSN